MKNDTLDILIIGGGINGVGIARDAAGRGLKTLLVEQDDLAAHTSSWSTKLIHGGLRYLEYYEFRLVREALLERERLLKIARHLVHPLRFVLPHDRAIRPAWLVRLGLFLYDHLAPRQTLPGCARVDLRHDPRGAALKPFTDVGFEYSDCSVDDSRLVVVNALDAKERGAEIRVGTRLERAERESGLWRAQISDARTGESTTVYAKILVNAAGPWVAEVLNHKLMQNTTKQVRLVKGSHIVVSKLYDGDHAFILQNPDKRIIFAIPYRGRFTLIGTTDVPYSGAPQDVDIDQDEIAYLLSSINRAFKPQLREKDIVWRFSGVRPLFDDGAIKASAVTRDYVFDLEAGDGNAPLLSIFGGKLTTYRKLAEHALRDLAPFLPDLKPAWTADYPLPGGDLPQGGLPALIQDIEHAYPFLAKPHAARLANAYGTRTFALLGPATSLADLGTNFGGDLTEAEVRYLVAHEWAQSARAILWRRSKLGLDVPQSCEALLDEWLQRTCFAPTQAGEAGAAESATSKAGEAARRLA